MPLFGDALCTSHVVHLLQVVYTYRDENSQGDPLAKDRSYSTFLRHGSFDWTDRYSIYHHFDAVDVPVLLSHRCRDLISTGSQTGIWT